MPFSFFLIYISCGGFQPGITGNCCITKSQNNDKIDKREKDILKHEDNKINGHKTS